MRLIDTLRGARFKTPDQEAAEERDRRMGELEEVRQWREHPETARLVMQIRRQLLAKRIVVSDHLAMAACVGYRDGLEELQGWIERRAEILKENA